MLRAGTTPAVTFLGIPVNRVLLAMLTAQTSGLFMILHSSRVMPPLHGHRYSPSTAVLLNEILKLTVSLTMALYELNSKQPDLPATTLFIRLLSTIFTFDCWRMAIPALLYTFQNTLQYIAASNLDASTFLITYQLRILTTAVLSFILLKRSHSTRKWLSLLLLTTGVAVIQLHPMVRHTSDTALWMPHSYHELEPFSSNMAPQLSKRSASYQGIDKDIGLLEPRMNSATGFAAVALASVSSGLASVYFEKVFKHSSASSGFAIGSGANIWVHNAQLSFFSLFPALFIGIMFVDAHEIAKVGFFAGYSPVVWFAIGLQASGGILVAMVKSHANNIAIYFATSIAIIISLLGSIVFFDLDIDLHYLAGAIAVLGALWLYYQDKQVQSPPIVVANFDSPTSSEDHKVYFDDFESVLLPASSLQRGGGLSTSRPGTPGLSERRSPSRNRDQNDSR